MTLRCLNSNQDQEPTDQAPPQGFAFNNLKHNPAIIGNLQISIIVMIFLAGSSSATLMINKSPDHFIVGSLIGALATYFVVPLLIYVFNKKLRKYWRQEIMNGLGNNQVGQGITISVIEPSTHNGPEEIEMASL